MSNSRKYFPVVKWIVDSTKTIYRYYNMRVKRYFEKHDEQNTAIMRIPLQKLYVTAIRTAYNKVKRIRISLLKCKISFESQQNTLNSQKHHWTVIDCDQRQMCSLCDCLASYHMPKWIGHRSETSNQYNSKPANCHSKEGNLDMYCFAASKLLMQKGWQHSKT